MHPPILELLPAIDLAMKMQSTVHSRYMLFWLDMCTNDLAKWLRQSNVVNGISSFIPFKGGSYII